MNRRKVIKSVGLLVGGTVIGSEAFLMGCVNKTKGPLSILKKDQVALFEEVAETILPHTSNSPGAKDAEIGKFMEVIVNDYYSPLEQKIFMDGLDEFKSQAFLTLAKEEKEIYVLNQEKKVEESPIIEVTNTEGKVEETVPAYIMIKQLTVWGYRTSEIVAKNAFHFLPIPGRYDGCVNVTEETKPIF